MSLFKSAVKFALREIAGTTFQDIGHKVGNAIGEVIAKKIQPDSPAKDSPAKDSPAKDSPAKDESK